MELLYVLVAAGRRLEKKRPGTCLKHLYLNACTYWIDSLPIFIVFLR
jgi:hypothetical protein